jgi:hypothetical protein
MVEINKTKRVTKKNMYIMKINNEQGEIIEHKSDKLKELADIIGIHETSLCKRLNKNIKTSTHGNLKGKTQLISIEKIDNPKYIKLIENKKEKEFNKTFKELNNMVRQKIKYDKNELDNKPHILKPIDDDWEDWRKSDKVLHIHDCYNILSYNDSNNLFNYNTQELIRINNCLKNHINNMKSIKPINYKDDGDKRTPVLPDMWYKVDLQMITPELDKFIKIINDIIPSDDNNKVTKYDVYIKYNDITKLFQEFELHIKFFDDNYKYCFSFGVEGHTIFWYNESYDVTGSIFSFIGRYDDYFKLVDEIQVKIKPRCEDIIYYVIKEQKRLYDL